MGEGTLWITARLVFHIKVTGLLWVLKDEVVLKVPPTCSQHLIKEPQTKPQMNEPSRAPNSSAMKAGQKGEWSPKEETL